jgi:excisionase family DNA binding protein
MDTLYTIKETAAKLKLHPDTVRKWVRRGTFHAIKVGDTWRVREIEIELYLKKRAA